MGSWVDGNWIPGEYIDGIYYPDQVQPQAPVSIWEAAQKKQNELGLTPGMEGTTTFYAAPDMGIGTPKTSLTPFDGANPYTFYTPPTGSFVSPTEGMDRFYKQALGGEIQEEYVDPAVYGAQGKDTTNFDRLVGVDPYKKDWGLSDSASFWQKPEDWNIVDNVLKNPGMMFAITNILGAAGAFSSLSSALAPAAQAGAGVDDALGAFLMEAGELPAASAYGQSVLQGTANWAIPGVSGAGGALGYTGALGTAVNDPLGAWLLEQNYPMDPKYAAEVLSGTPNWSIPGVSGAGGSLGYQGSDPSLWDKIKNFVSPSAADAATGGTAAKGLLDYVLPAAKIAAPFVLSKLAADAAEEDGGGGEGTGLWSNTATVMPYNAPRAGQPIYQALEATPFYYDPELRRRIAELTQR